MPCGFPNLAARRRKKDRCCGLDCAATALDAVETMKNTGEDQVSHTASDAARTAAPAAAVCVCAGLDVEPGCCRRAHAPTPAAGVPVLVRRLERGWDRGGAERAAPRRFRRERERGRGRGAALERGGELAARDAQAEPDGADAGLRAEGPGQGPGEGAAAVVRALGCALCARECVCGRAGADRTRCGVPCRVGGCIGVVSNLLVLRIFV